MRKYQSIKSYIKPLVYLALSSSLLSLLPMAVYADQGANGIDKFVGVYINTYTFPLTNGTSIAPVNGNLGNTDFGIPSGAPGSLVDLMSFFPGGTGIEDDTNPTGVPLSGQVSFLPTIYNGAVIIPFGPGLNEQSGSNLVTPAHLTWVKVGPRTYHITGYRFLNSQLNSAPFNGITSYPPNSLALLGVISINIVCSSDDCQTTSFKNATYSFYSINDTALSLPLYTFTASGSGRRLH